ncbi:MAG TPA: transcriptional regulator [Spirochaetota bacterium]|nr:transcriptional regulator [Spirochaetota bacterium]HOL56846.1 transcriptional regulator [Spirochaetota bacterium]HPP04407.1 transcriptional regulator [Spirochaetota bacterium]
MADLMIKEKTKNDFDKAYFEALFKNIISKIKGKENDLLSFNDVIKYIKVKNECYKGMQFVAIDDIVGSEGRYNDFTREFLPEKRNLKDRWTRIDEAHYKDIILPPIQLYQIGKVYFVRDGNHRVSVARRQGKEFIDAEVIEIQTDIVLDSSVTKEDLEKLIIKHERENFLKITGLDKERDVSMINFSSPGRFDELMIHIQGHQYFLGIERKENVSFHEAMISWYDNLFMPIIKEIEDKNILIRFPGRTSADLYVWIIKYWDELKKKYDSNAPISEAVKSYSKKFGENPIKSFIKWLFRG